MSERAKRQELSLCRHFQERQASNTKGKLPMTAGNTNWKNLFWGHVALELSFGSTVHTKTMFPDISCSLFTQMLEVVPCFISSLELFCCLNWGTNQPYEIILSYLFKDHARQKALAWFLCAYRLFLRSWQNATTVSEVASVVFYINDLRGRN